MNEFLYRHQEYSRQRNGQDPKPSRMILWLNVVLIGLVLVVFAVLSLVLPKPTESLIEKRKLTELPTLTAQSLFLGEYTVQLESFYADTFPFREGFVKLAAQFDDLKGFRLDNVKIHQTTSPVTQQPNSGNSASQGGSSSGSAVSGSSGSSDASSGSSESQQPPVVEDDPNKVGERRDAVFIYDGKALPIFGGYRPAAKRYTEVLNAYYKELGDEVNIYNLVIPSPIEFALPPKYKSVTTPEKPNIDYIYENLDPGITAVDAYTPIQMHSDEYLYFATDHHWTVYGAYWAYTAFAEAAGFTPIKLEDYEKRTKDNFLGSLYLQTMDPSLEANPDYVDYYLTDVGCTAYRYERGAPYTPVKTTVFAEYASGSSSYGVFLHGDLPLMQIQTPNHNGRKLIIFKESFGNAFAPLTLPNFEEVYVVDIRYFELNAVDFIREHGITDVLFINNIFAANTDFQINHIQRLFNLGK